LTDVDAESGCKSDLYRGAKSSPGKDLGKSDLAGAVVRIEDDRDGPGTVAAMFPLFPGVPNTSFSSSSLTKSWTAPWRKDIFALAPPRSPPSADRSAFRGVLLSVPLLFVLVTRSGRSLSRRSDSVLSDIMLVEVPNSRWGDMAGPLNDELDFDVDDDEPYELEVPKYGAMGAEAYWRCCFCGEDLGGVGIDKAG
jgi:hypothetical protein